MATVHLHHLFDVPRALERVSAGYGMCGKKVSRAQLTRFKDDCTCSRCLDQAQKKAPAHDRGEASESQHIAPKARGSHVRNEK
jgi:hypothetical protein